MKKLLSLLLMFSSMLFIASCGDDDDDDVVDGAAPTITGPASDGTALANGPAVDLAFSFTSAAGFASTTVETTAGSASATTDGTAGAESGDLVISLTPPATSGDVIVTVTVTDVNGAIASATGTVAVSFENVVSSNIEADVTWTSGNIYALDGRITVTSGATLTIEPGVVVKGETGEGAEASALIIARGGMIMAEGTASEPIIFTTVLDGIAPGEIASPNLDENDNGQWGGLIVLGNAPISADAAAVQIEGIPADDTNGLYGGSDAADNSGVIRYVSIRHGGANIGEGNEINGLTLGGVGSGTTVEFVEVVANQDDGIELFGGTVDVTNALVWAQADDAYDIDQAYSGTIDNFIYIAGAESDHGFEIDGPEGSGTGSFIAQNGTLRGLNAEMADFRDGATGTVRDCYFFNFDSSGDVELDADGSDDPDSADPSDPDALSDNPANSDNFANGSLVITGNEFSSTFTDVTDAATLADIFSDRWALSPSANGFDPADTRTDAQAEAQAASNETTFIANNSIVETATVGADETVFANWTFASANGALDDF